MKCWICETNEANSGEHNIKKSDLKTLYPEISQKTPVLKRSNGVISRPIGSTKSDSFKYQKVICEYCNNSRTQPFDEGWETLSDHLSKNWGEISAQNRFKVNAIFPCNPQSNMIKVQLFFIKLLGCAIKESSNNNFDTKTLSEALINSVEHENVYISFRSSDKSSKGNYAANSDVQMSIGCNEEINYLHWFYIVGSFAVDVIYTENPEGIDLNGAQKPSQIGEFITLSQLNYDQSYQP